MTPTIDAGLFLQELTEWLQDYVFGASDRSHALKLTSILDRIKTARTLLERVSTAAGPPTLQTAGGPLVSVGHLYSSEFMVGDPVHIDGDSTLTATVTGLMFRSHAIPPMVECSWMLGGDSKVQIFEAWRLKRVRE